MSKITDYNYGAALLTATETEMAAVMRMYDWREKIFGNDSQIYYEAEFTGGGTIVQIVAARQNAMGMTAAVTLSTKVMIIFVRDI